jgi:hypothetical protein
VGWKLAKAVGLRGCILPFEELVQAKLDYVDAGPPTQTHEDSE